VTNPAVDLPARMRELGLAGSLSASGRETVVEFAVAEQAEVRARLEAPEEGGVLALLAGRIAVTRPEDARVIAELGPGSILAAISALEREVELVATEPCEIARLPAAGVDRLMSVDPAGLAGVAARVAESERALQVAIHLSRLFPGLDRSGLDAFGAGAEWLTLGGGEWLFREGDAGDAAYLVVSGRLRAVAGARDEERVLNEVGPGETVGEMALLTDDVRSASIHAVRDSQLVRLSRAVFDELTDRHPQALRRISGFVVQRLRRHADGRAARSPLTTICVVGAHPGVALDAFSRRLSDALAQSGSVELVDRARVEARLGRPGIADAEDDEAAGIRLVRWLNERDATSRYVVYLADAGWSPWTRRALRQADHVLVVAHSQDGPEPGETERRMTEDWSASRAPQRSLVLLHPSGTAPRGTAAWLGRRDVHGHFHVREGRTQDVARLARLLTGNGVGLVLGGGGARGFAHLGALRALEEACVPVDFVGGTSIGSIIGALAAMGLGADESQEVCRRYISALFDPTLPIVSLLAGRRIGGRLKEGLGDGEVEDLPIPFFCIATNISQAEAVVHRRGSLFSAVRSSISLPGILPPVTLDGDLYVDGGLLNNLPIDVMTRVAGGGPVVAIDVSPEEDLRSEIDLTSAISGWRVLWQRINPFASRLDVPYISSVLMRSVVVGSMVRERERRSAELASLYLRMPVEDWGLLEFDRLDAIARRGYEASAERVRAWWAQQKAD
jgi:predicted acylesterase/phospholipase RssA/CRP-like cAMP-binding protein